VPEFLVNGKCLQFPPSFRWLLFFHTCKIVWNSKDK
jgi:hypothetical protein